jgi:hypothetical protein
MMAPVTVPVVLCTRCNGDGEIEAEAERRGWALGTVRWNGWRAGALDVALCRAAPKRSAGS